MDRIRKTAVEKTALQLPRAGGNFFADKMNTPAVLNGKGFLPLG